MLSPLIKNTNFRYYTFVLVILFMKLHSQDINSQYSLELNPGISNQWWSQYNNYGRELSEIGLTVLKFQLRDLYWLKKEFQKFSSLKFTFKTSFVV